MSDTTVKKPPTIDELFEAGELNITTAHPALVSYIYHNGQCVGTMWVEVDHDTSRGFFETCFDPYHKCLERLKRLVKAPHWNDAEEALAQHVLDNDPREYNEGYN
jgi:hypothetical protein